mgnify:CR=1 FL=1
MKKGKLIVFEGTDGSGKATQVKLLSDYLVKQKIAHEVISFPRYGENPYANLIRSYLDGELGSMEKVDPHLISLAFAGDRFLAKNKIEKWLDSGKLVILDRYVSSNKAHMGAEMPDKERKEFIKWLDNLEYETNQLPREDLVIFLHVGANLIQKNVKNKKGDILERDLIHQKNTESIYLELAKSPNWVTINCMKNGKMRPKEDIHEDILKKLNKFL